MDENKLFTIILPTYKREDKLIHAVESIKRQTYSNWRIIILNDSPDCSYKKFEQKYLPDEKIIYLKNEKNVGKNAELNIALDYLQQNKQENILEYITFLDDDDWFNEKAIENMNKITEEFPNNKWFISNRVMKNNTVITRFKRKTRKSFNKRLLNYAKNYWIFKKMIGDTTILLDIETALSARFSKKIKNGEEWFYFSTLPAKKFLYYNFNSTISDGYLLDGITKNFNSKSKRIKNTLILAKELLNNKLLNFWHFIYFPLRLGSILIKSNKAQIEFVEEITKKEF
ncbi:MAG: glycosyltransferase family 2 protein [Bacteroidales bacterium]|nr:glycosyltransferase family 2 protein [Bacteroidales bacterium]